MSEKSQSFESAMARLDTIVKSLEKGDVALSDALNLFREGTGLVQQCSTMLDEAELQVVKLMKGADGAPVEVEFTDEGTV